mgnify:CR=1 FL=1
MIITPTDEDKHSQFNVFVAGPVKGVHDWQTEFANRFSDTDITFFNPRRSIEESDNFIYEEQVKWESEHLRYADLIVFCVPPKEYDVQGRSYAQTTMFELSEWLQKGKQLLIYIDNSYPLFNYIVKKYPEQIIFTQDELEDQLREIYKNFCNRAPKVFFTSDTHFNQQRTLELSLNRRFIENLNAMNELLIRNWNNVVTNKDIVYHLGDFGDYEYLKYLKGHVRLILGNYEQSDIKNGMDVHKFYTYGFESVQDKTTLDFDGTHITCIHKPTNYNKYSDFNLFGHIHGRQQCKPFGMDVGVDAQNYTPISLDDVLRFKNAYKYYDQEVWIN